MSAQLLSDPAACRRQRGAALGLALLAPVLAAAASYVAPPPPDAVVLAGTDRGAHADVFLSKQTPEEVRAFYAAQLGPLGRGASDYQALSPVILSYQQVLNILMSRHRDLTLADDLRVDVKWKPPGNGQAQCAGDFFRELFSISKLQHRETEFEALCKQYGYLQNAYFQRVPDPQHPGHLADADKVILARAHDSLGGSQSRALAPSAAQSAQQIGALALSGHAQEASALAAQLQQQALKATSGVTDWNAWVGVLRQGDAVGYRTWVELPTHPSTW